MDMNDHEILALRIGIKPVIRKLHKKLGFLLGYPPCCIDAFIKFFREDFLCKHKDVFSEDDKHPNFIMNTFNNTPDTSTFPFVLNNLSSNRLISFFPCSYTCKKSILLAEKILYGFSKEKRESISLTLKKDLLVFSEHHFLDVTQLSRSNEEYKIDNGVLFYFR
jgi:hypothetical protein